MKLGPIDTIILLGGGLVLKKLLILNRNTRISTGVSV